MPFNGEKKAYKNTYF